MQERGAEDVEMLDAGAAGAAGAATEQRQKAGQGGVVEEIGNLGPRARWRLPGAFRILS
jgi:hypothetical protein